MSQKTENTGFTCENCGEEVLPLSNGTYRNHCPFCLASKHVDGVPGDRAGGCGGLMEAIEVRMSGHKGWQLVHRCRKCGTVSLNRIAEMTVQPDDVEKLASIPQNTAPVKRSR